MPQIASSSDPDDPRPWFRFDMDSVTMQVDVAEANGLAAAPWTNASKSDEKALRENSKHAVGLSSEKPDERHVLAVTTGGTVEFVPQSEQQPVYYAHLAWYDPKTDTLEKLEFTEA